MPLREVKAFTKKYYLSIFNTYIISCCNKRGLFDAYIATAQADGLDTEKYLTELFSQPAGTIYMLWRN